MVFFSQKQTRSYNIVIFVFDFFLPAAIIIFSYAFIVKAIFAHEAAMRAQAKKMNVTTLRSNVSLAFRMANQ